MSKFYALLCLVITLLFAAGHSYAQYENIWAFGTHSGLDFNGNGPLPVFYPTKIATQGGSASVCDASGQLLFYTEGDIVWDKNGNRMPGTSIFGQGLTGLPQDTTWGGPGFTLTSTTGAQNAMIVPMLKEPGKYFIFSLSYIFGMGSSSSSSKLFYSVIDMSLNGGLGDVVAGQKGILVDSNLNAKITGVMGDQCNIWVVVLSTYPTAGPGVEFKAYRVTSDGLDPTPVVSNTGILPGLYPPFCTEIKFSSNRKKLAVTWANGFIFPLEGGLGIFDFDPFTGQFSNEVVLTPNYDKPFFGVEFSPDNSKLYANLTSSWYTGAPKGIFQYDLSSNTTAAIINSAVLLDSLTNSVYGETSLKRGPDGKIYYFPCEGAIGGYIGAINYPNLPGLACQINDSALLLVSVSGEDTGSIWFGLPNAVPVLIPDTTHSLTMDTLCQHQENVLVLQSPLSPAQYLWNDGSTDSGYSAANAGVFWVRSNNYCHYRIDSFRVKTIDIDYDLGPSDTTVCEASSLKLSVPLDNAGFLWQDGTTDPDYTVNSSGIYWVAVTREGCISSDTIHVTLKNVQQEFGPDIVLCKGNPIAQVLKAYVPDGSTALWSTGDAQASIIARDTGLYWVAVTDAPCVGTDSIHIGIDPFCTCVLQVPNAFSPNGDGLNDVFSPTVSGGCPVDHYVLNIYNRFGQRIFSSVRIENGWDGRYNGGMAEAGTYMFELSFTGGTREKDYYKKGDLVLIR